MNTTFLSKRGFKELRSAIARLESEEKSLHAKLKEVSRPKSRDERLEFNEIVAARDLVQDQLVEKRQVLKTARPMPRKRDRLYVAIGSVVDLIDQQGRLFRYTLVDSLEANPLDGRISDQSPLGASLLGRQVSDKVVIDTSRQPRELTLLQVR